MIQKFQHQIAIFLFFTAILWNIVFLKSNEFWTNHLINFNIIGSLICIFGIINIIYFVFTKYKISFSRTIASLIGILLLSFSIINLQFFYNFLFLICNIGFSFFCFHILRKKLSLAHSYLIGLGLLQILIFCLMFLNLFNMTFVSIFFVVLSLIGLFQKRTLFKLKSIKFKTDIISLNLYTGLAICFIFSFFLTNIIQTQPDGITYRLNFLKDIENMSTFPFHLYLWDYLTPQTIKLLLIPGYKLLGEFGASVHIFCFYLIAIHEVFNLSKKQLDVSHRGSLFISLLIASSPILWIGSFSIYAEVVILAYSLAGIRLIMKSSTKETFKFFIAGCMFGIAATLKLNALLYNGFFVLFFIAIRCFKQKNLQEMKSFFWIVFGGITFCAPQFIKTWIDTGNPIFPITNSLFYTHITDGSAVFSQYALVLYHYPVDLLHTLLFPINIFLKTSQFGAFVNGTPGTIFIWTILVGTLLALTNKLKLSHNIYNLLFSSVLTIIATYIGTKMFVIRYWIVAYVCLQIAFVVILDRKTIFFKNNNFASQLTCILGTIWLVSFLSMAGDRLNYGMGLGVAEFFSNKKHTMAKERVYKGIPSFINSRIKATETTFTTGYYPIHKIKNNVFIVTTGKALLGKVHSLQTLKEFIKNKNVKYWIINRDANLDFFNIMQIDVNSFLTNNRLVFGYGSFLVYDLTRSTHDIKGNRNNMETTSSIHEININETNSSFLFDACLKINSKHKINTFIATINQKTEKGIIDQKMHGFAVSDQECQVKFMYPKIPGASKIQILLKPWREQDGSLISNEGIFRAL